MAFGARWISILPLMNFIFSAIPACIDCNPAPANGTLHLPKSPLGQLVYKAYAEQTSLEWNLLFRGLWTISRRTAQEYEYSHCQFTLDFQDNGASWAGRAQMWMFDLFEVAWGLRNATEHGARTLPPSA
jgi:hypothetical protein